MSNFNHEVAQVDENARDEFSAAHVFKKTNNNKAFCQIPIFKKKSVLSDITHTAVNNLNVSNSNNRVGKEQEIFNINNYQNVSGNTDIGKKFNKSNIQFEAHKNEIGLILKQPDCLKPINEPKSPANKRGSTENKDIIENYFIPSKRFKNGLSIDNSNEILFSLFKQFESEDKQFDNAYKVFQDLSSNLNSCYQNFVSVPSDPSHRLLLVNEKSQLWKHINEISIIDTRPILMSSRKSCIPQQQFLIINNQYKSSCIISKYITQASAENIIDCEKSEQLAKKYNQSLFHVDGRNNFLYFHELSLEKLQCNKMRDFMPSSTNLTGISLSTFVNSIFEYSKKMNLPSSTIHLAVEFLYQYLNRVNNVPEEDLKWITMASITLASKYDGSLVLFNGKKESREGCPVQRSELLLMMVIDSNLSKPHAIYFRNRFLTIEESNSSVFLLSSFILDMVLHCYTVMLEPASLRAASAVWLARLIDRFDTIRFNKDFWNNMPAAREIMDSVWPKSFELLSGYSHKEISLLALRMHVIIVTFLAKGKDIYPSVKACIDKYSHSKYGGLTTSYVKFTARTMCYASELYCCLNDLDLKTWLGEGEFETLMETFWANKIKLGRSASYCAPVKQNENSSNSNLVPKIKQIMSLPGPTTDTITNDSNQGETYTQDATLLLVSKDFQMHKMDSGYSTCSNLSISRDK